MPAGQLAAVQQYMKLHVTVPFGINSRVHAWLQGTAPSDSSICTEVLAILMQLCWDKDPNARPEFSEVLGVDSLIL